MDPLHLVGMGFSLASTILTNIAILIQKHSAAVEKGRPVWRRWRFWCGFWLNTASEAGLSSVALWFTPLALIAPLGGVGVVFNALLARFGLVCGIREHLTLKEGLATFVILAGVTLVAVSGPGSGSSETGATVDLSTMHELFEQPAFLSFACLAFALVTWTILLFHVPQLKRWRPDPKATATSIFSGTSAACCGAFSVVFLKLVVTGIFMFFTPPHPIPPGVFWVALVGLFTSAPLQLYLLNISLASGAATFTIPLYLSCIMLFMSLAGGLLFQEFTALLRSPVPLYLILYVSGVGFVIAGLAYLSYTQQQKETLKESLKTLEQSGPDALPEIATTDAIHVENGDAPASVREPHARACPIVANGCHSARGDAAAAECGSGTILTDRQTSDRWKGKPVVAV